MRRRVGRVMVPGLRDRFRLAAISVRTRCRSSLWVTGTAWAGRSARMPCFRWKVKSGWAERSAYQLVGRPEVPLQRQVRPTARQKKI